MICLKANQLKVRKLELNIFSAQILKSDAVEWGKRNQPELLYYEVMRLQDGTMNHIKRTKA
jgi:hypothetical protein